MASSWRSGATTIPAHPAAASSRTSRPPRSKRLRQRRRGWRARLAQGREADTRSMLETLSSPREVDYELIVVSARCPSLSSTLLVTPVSAAHFGSAARTAAQPGSASSRPTSIPNSMLIVIACWVRLADEPFDGEFWTIFRKTEKSVRRFACRLRFYHCVTTRHSHPASIRRSNRRRQDGFTKPHWLDLPNQVCRSSGRFERLNDGETVIPDNSMPLLIHLSAKNAARESPYAP